MRALLPVALVAQCALVLGGCITTADCFFGGTCVGGTCACRPEWGGENCTQLTLHAAAGSGMAYSQPLSSSWGGSVLRVGRTYYMAVAVLGHCGINSWESNSAIALASSSMPEGPYEAVAGAPALLLSEFASNPTMHATANGSIVLAHVGQGVPTPSRPPLVNCTNGTTPPGVSLPPTGSTAAPPLRLGVINATLPSPNFLYLASGNPADGSAWAVLNSSGGVWAANNPALLIAADDSALLVYETDCPCPGGCFCRQFGVATAPNWAGPYSDRGLVPVYGEDAYIWRDQAGTLGGGYHMLFQGGNYAPQYPQYAGHWHTACSADGLAWTVEAASEAFNGTLVLARGGPLQLARRERHQLLFIGGRPAYLFNGATLATGAAGDASFTSVQPIATFSRSFVWDPVPDPQAVCLDGSPYGLITCLGGGPLVNVTINLQGGGWAYDEALSLHRSKTREGSSATYPSEAQALECSPQNGTLYVNMWYCDGLSFCGYREAPFPIPGANASVFFRGQQILDASIDYMVAKYGLAQPSVQLVVVTGGSAGGLSVFLHLDHFAARLRAAGSGARVVGYPMFGFFPDASTDTLPPVELWPQQMRYAVSMQNATGALLPACKEALGANNSWRCILAPHAAPFVQQELFVSNSRDDTFSLMNVKGLACSAAPFTCAPEDWARVQAYGAEFMGQLQPFIDQPGSRNGGFIHSCLIHGTTGAAIDGLGADAAFASWLAGNQTQRWWIQRCNGSETAGPCDRTSECEPFPQ